jgi:hypothetical protein
MIFLTAMLIGLAAALQRSSAGAILGVALIGTTFMAALVISPVAPPLMTLFIALGGYNLGFIGYLVTQDALAHYGRA